MHLLCSLPEASIRTRARTHTRILRILPSPFQVPSLFQDNFDYGDIRRDFVYGVLTSDLLMKNVYCYVAKDGYAARVADTRSYDAVRYVVVAAAFLARVRARARSCLCVCLCVRLWSVGSDME